MSKNKEINIQTLKIPKIILITAKFLEVIAPKLAIKFAAKLFTTPIKHKTPKREFQMDEESIQEQILIPSINKKIVVYKYSQGDKRILLIHGWSGRGTQLYKIANELVNLGYQTISFDAPAHGKSSGNNTIMTEFISSIIELEKQFGPFEFAIGHSLGGMALLNAIKTNLKVKKAIIIGSGDIIQDIIDDFISKLKLNPQNGIMLKEYFEEKFKIEMDYYSASRAAKEITIPVLVIHDENDDEVNIKAAHNIHHHLKNSELMITNRLGHRKILGNTEVINRIIKFIK